MAFHPFGISPYFGGESATLAASGGALLGATVIFKTLLNGNVLAVSGSTRACFTDPRSCSKIAFLVGLSISGPAMAAAYGGFEPMPPPANVNRGLLLVRLVVGGILIGAGTSFGGGCTSGHGLTGLARMSFRSWVAVPVFMLFGAAAASVCCTLDALPPDAAKEAETPAWWAGATVAAVGILFLLAAAAAILAARDRLEVRKLISLVEIVSGLAFGVGLAVSGMVKPSKVAAFLDLRSGMWDPSLAFVMGAALVFTFPFFQILEFRSLTPLVQQAFDLPDKKAYPDGTMILGCMLFGMGWGVTGACPGPVWVLLFAVPSLEVAMVWVGMLIGTLVWVLWIWFGAQAAPVVPGEQSPVGNISVMPDTSGLRELDIEVPVLPGDVALAGSVAKSEIRRVASRFRSWLFLNGSEDPSFHEEEIKRAGCECQAVAFANANPLPSGTAEALLKAMASLPRPVVVQSTSGNRAAIVLLLHLAKEGRLGPASAKQLAADLDMKIFTDGSAENEPLRQWVLREVAAVIASISPVPSPGIIYSGPGPHEPWVEQLHDAESGAYSYLVACPSSKDSLLIDPRASQKHRDMALLKERGFSLCYVATTHCYVGRGAAVEAVVKESPVAKTVMLESAGVEADVIVNDGHVLTVGTQSVEVLATPGHTRGCASFVLNKAGVAHAVFTGNCLLIRGCGRTDGPQGDAGLLHRSVHERLFTLPLDTKVFPGHDSEGRNISTVQEERLFNERMALSEAEFVHAVSDLEVVQAADCSVAEAELR